MSSNPKPTKVDTSSLVEIVQVHRFFLEIYGKPKSRGGRPAILNPPEIATITLIQARYQIQHLVSLHKFLVDYFSVLQIPVPAYQNFVLSMHRGSLFLLELVILVLRTNCTDTSRVKIIDSTPLPVCKIYRASKHRVTEAISSKKLTTTGWFYGLKLHLMCDTNYNLLTLRFTTGSRDDRVVLQDFLQRVTDSTIIADAGYVSKEYEYFASKYNNYLFTVSRKNMKTLATLYQEKLMNLRGRVETVFSVLKDKYFLVSTVSRSITGYLTHYTRSIFMYVFEGVGRVS